MSRYTYEIDDNNALRMWDAEVPNENNAPFLFQPNWPNGVAWADAQEAAGWADAFITSLEDPNSPLVAGDGPDAPVKERVVETTVEEAPAE